MKNLLLIKNKLFSKLENATNNHQVRLAPFLCRTQKEAFLLKEFLEGLWKIKFGNNEVLDEYKITINPENYNVIVPTIVAKECYSLLTVNQNNLAFSTSEEIKQVLNIIETSIKNKHLIIEKLNEISKDHTLFPIKIINKDQSLSLSPKCLFEKILHSEIKSSDFPIDWMPTIDIKHFSKLEENLLSELEEAFPTISQEQIKLIYDDYLISYIESEKQWIDPVLYLIKNNTISLLTRKIDKLSNKIKLPNTFLRLVENPEIVQMSTHSVIRSPEKREWHLYFDSQDSVRDFVNSSLKKSWLFNKPLPVISDKNVFQGYAIKFHSSQIKQCLMQMIPHKEEKIDRLISLEAALSDSERIIKEGDKQVIASLELMNMELKNPIKKQFLNSSGIEKDNYAWIKAAIATLDMSSVLDMIDKEQRWEFIKKFEDIIMESTIKTIQESGTSMRFFSLLHHIPKDEKTGFTTRFKEMVYLKKIKELIIDFGLQEIEKMVSDEKWDKQYGFFDTDSSETLKTLRECLQNNLSESGLLFHYETVLNRVEGYLREALENAFPYSKNPYYCLYRNLLESVSNIRKSYSTIENTLEELPKASKSKNIAYDFSESNPLIRRSL